MNSAKRLNIKEILLDPQNRENIIQGDLSYLQIFSVVLNNTDKVYSILRVLRSVEGCKSNEAFVYLVDKTKLTRVKSRKIIKQVFGLYYKALRGEKVDAEIACVKMQEEVYKPYSVDSMENERKNTRTIQKNNFMKKLYNAFTYAIKGQNAAIIKIIKTLCGADNIPNSRGPKAIFTLLGAPGVGKTALVEVWRECQNLELTYLNCTIFVDRESIFLVVGIPPSFKDSHGGMVTLSFLKTPYGNLIFWDEFDKAHANIRAQLYMALDQGKLHDNFLRMDIDLSQSIFIFASNAGESIYNRPGTYNLADTPKEAIIEALKREKDNEGKPTFPDALISRFASGDMIVMNNLSPMHVKEILIDEIHRKVEAFLCHEEINFKVDADGLAELLIYKNINNLDIRNMKKQIHDFFVAQHVYSTNMIGEIYPNAYVDEIVCNFDILGKDKEVDKMIISDKKPKILLLGKSESTEAIHRLECVDIVEGNLDDIDTYTTRKSGIEMVLLDATDSLSAAKKNFDAIKERTDVPMFVFSRNNLSMADLFYFLENGIDDYHIPSHEISFENWIKKLASGMKFNSVCNRLTRKRKAIVFSEMYYFNEKTKELQVNADVTVKDIFARSENGKIISWDKDTRRHIAVHEAGHALVGLVLQRPVDLMICIESRGNTAGYVIADDADVFAYTSRQLRNIICQCLAGRAAEELIYADTTTGASEDLKKATYLATEMVCKYGMLDSLMVSEDVKASKLDIEKILQTEYERAKTILSERINIIEKIATELCVANSLSGEELERIIEDVKD